MTPDWPTDAVRWPTMGVGKMDQPSCGRGGTSDSTRCQALWATRNCRDWMRFLTSVKQWRPNTPPDCPETLNLFSPVSKNRVGRPGSHTAFASRDGGTQYFRSIPQTPAWQGRSEPNANNTPVADSISGRTIALPFYAGLSSQEIDLVCQSLELMIERATFRHRASPTDQVDGIEPS